MPAIDTPDKLNSMPAKMDELLKAKYQQETKLISILLKLDNLEIVKKKIQLRAS